MEGRTGYTLLLCLVPVLAASAPRYYNTTTCVPVTITSCFSAEVTFSHTTHLFTNVTSQEEVEAELAVWSLLKRVPECWAVIQPFLCSVYLPKCNATEQKVERPNRELCERVRYPCEVVTKYNGEWPSFLQCDQSFYAEEQWQTVFETSVFNTSGECVAPLISTSEEANWYDKIKGCGIQCENPLYTGTEHEIVHVLVAVMGSLCILTTLFTLVTFMVDWKTGRKYPAVILFFINGCFFLGSLGWMAQFIGREDIVCRKDGTIRKGEPLIGSGETASCTVVFILVYYFMMAGVVWFVMLAYSWDITFKALGTVRDDLSKKTAYFHIISWCLPLVLTIVCLSISQIDADSLSGICFPGYFDSLVRAGFVLAPIGLVLIIGSIFSIRGLITLVRVRKNTPQFISDKATAKIQSTIVRLGIFTVLAFGFVFTTLSVHIYTFTKEGEWEKSFEDYTYCRTNVSVMQIFANKTPVSCDLNERPSVVAAIIHVLAFFGAGIAMSSWSWTRASLEAWERVFRRICNKPVNRPQKLRKHRVIAKAFKRRKKRNNERLSISYGTDHDDPMGMKFDLNSNSSHSLSSGYAVAMPKGYRRKGIVNPGFGPSRRHSDSDMGSHGSRISSSRRQSSGSSRRESYESSMSQKLSDIERDIRREERRKRRRKRRKKRLNRIQPILEPISSTMAAMQQRRHRHRSDSSDQSRMSARERNIIARKNNVGNYSIGSSNILSDSVTTGNSLSEMELPQHKMPDFSMFTANTMLPPIDKEDNSTGQAGPNLKGAKSSPSGSFRRGRRREVKLEMTETSFYQEDDDNIEMGGNQTFHREENCHETGEYRGNNLKELGPLVTEIFEQARANSASGRNSGQRDVMGSSRLGSASSRGSRGSRGSQAKDGLKYATTKVVIPDKPQVPVKPGQRRPFSGDYVLVAKRDKAREDLDVRKSQSQPGSRVSSATHHKRQIGQNGRIDFTDGMSWSRFLQGKGHVPGAVFGYPHVFHKDPRSGYNQSSKVNQLQLMDKGHFENHNGPVDMLNVEEEHKQCFLATKRSPDTKPTVDILNVEEEQSHMSQAGDSPNVTVLNVEEEHRRLAHCEGCGEQRVDILNVEEEHKRCAKCNSASSGSRTGQSGSASSRASRNVQYSGLQAGQVSPSTRRLDRLKGRMDEQYYRQIDRSSILPGVEGNGDIGNLVDYDLDSEYDDMTDDLTDTYTYTSYDDDLTEVSSLPC